MNEFRSIDFVLFVWFYNKFNYNLEFFTTLFHIKSDRQARFPALSLYEKQKSIIQPYSSKHGVKILERGYFIIFSSMFYFLSWLMVCLLHIFTLVIYNVFDTSLRKKNMCMYTNERSKDVHILWMYGCCTKQHVGYWNHSLT